MVLERSIYKSDGMRFREMKMQKKRGVSKRFLPLFCKERSVFAPLREAEPSLSHTEVDERDAAMVAADEEEELSQHYHYCYFLCPRLHLYRAANKHTNSSNDYLFNEYYYCLGTRIQSFLLRHHLG